MKLLKTFALLLGISACSEKFPLETVNQVDLEKYQGRWYEIATIPIRAQQGCRCTYAEYTLNREKGYVEVYNNCQTADGETKDISGKAFAVENTGNSELKVQFFWPFKGDYQIIALDEDYRYAMVGAPNRDNLWILSRSPQLDEVTYQSLLETAKEKDFDISRLVKTPQDCY